MIFTTRKNIVNQFKKENVQKNETTVLAFLSPFEIIEFGDKETVIFSKIQGQLEKKGNTIGSNDLIISSIVLSHNGILVTKSLFSYIKIGISQSSQSSRGYY